MWLADNYQCLVFCYAQLVTKSCMGEVKMNKPIQSKRKGSVLALVMVILVIMLVMGVGLLSLGQSSRIRAARTGSEIVARSAADAGLTKALFEMNEKLKAKPWTDSNLPSAVTETLPNCDATLSYTVTVDGNNVYNIESIGSSGQAQKKVKSSLELDGLFEYAIFVKGILTLMNGTTIDMYNAGAGDPALQIGTNSTTAGAITAKTGVTIDGDVIVGPGGDPDTVIDSQLEAAITGDTRPGFKEEELASITVPTWLGALPSQGTLTGGTTVTTSAKYDNIDLGNSEISTIDGAVELYVTGDVILDNSAQLLIVDANTNPDASLTLYLGGNLISKNGGLINNAAMDPHKVKIYGLDTCTGIHFMTNSIFYGAIYAPNADVQLNAKVDYYGSCIADSFTQNVDAFFHYDASLREVSADEVGVHFVVKQWNEE